MAAFQPGPDPRRNTAGRPRKGQSLAETIRAKMPVAAIVKKLSDMAKDGNIQAATTLFSYGWAKPVTDIDDRLKAIEDRLDEAEREAAV